MSSTFSFLPTSTVALFVPQYSRNLKAIMSELRILLEYFKVRRSQWKGLRGSLMLATIHDVYFLTELIATKEHDLKKFFFNMLVDIF